MKDNRDEIDFIKVDIASFQDMCKRIQELEARNKFLERANKGIRLNNAKLTQERNALIDELHSIKRMSMFEFGNTYCSNESLEADGKAFARALLGGA